MTKEQAIETLAYHSGLRLERPDCCTGECFLDALRPYRGILPEAAYHDVMASIRSLAHDLQKPVLDREVIASIWSICDLGRAWGVYPGGMLRRNGLITDDDTKTLATWIETISSATFWLLTRTPSQDTVEHAFTDYDAPNDSRPLIPAI